MRKTLLRRLRRLFQRRDGTALAAPVPRFRVPAGVRNPAVSGGQKGAERAAGVAPGSRFIRGIAQGVVGVLVFGVVMAAPQWFATPDIPVTIQGLFAVEAKTFTSSTLAQQAAADANGFSSATNQTITCARGVSPCEFYVAIQLEEADPAALTLDLTCPGQTGFTCEGSIAVPANTLRDRGKVTITITDNPTEDTSITLSGAWKTT